MRPANTSRPLILVVIAMASCLSIASTAYSGELLNPPAASETSFLKENDVAMSKMMNGMSVQPSGDVDHDFVAMMIPHHQGAIDMAQAELRYGRNEQLRRIAQEIIVEQQQEIVAMRVALGQSLPPSSPSPDQIHPSQATGPDHSSMPMNMHMNMPMDSPASTSNHEEQK
ncbi:DUF305 domain-containing protein [Paraburkholderia tropica]|uniref:DUF305 domain-containing protein n=1 Tax=Paraburkholderia tropica TaxID=92647 RepID=UPI002AB0CCE9|nr:DUF305 domain-containing protein [Paraburkholderia tropica]